MNNQEIETPLEEETLIGILLIDTKSKEQIGFIEFSPQGVLVYQMITSDVHVFAFKGSIAPAINTWAKGPLYVKFKDVLKDNPKLPDNILEQEAGDCAEFLNTHKTPLRLGEHTVKALKVPIQPGKIQEYLS